jgi:hypothetical protein
MIKYKRNITTTVTTNNTNNNKHNNNVTKIKAKAKTLIKLFLHPFKEKEKNIRIVFLPNIKYLNILPVCGVLLQLAFSCVKDEVNHFKNTAYFLFFCVTV